MKETTETVFVCEEDWVVERNRHNNSHRPYLVAQLDRYRITYGEHTGGGPFFAAITDSHRRYIAERIVGCVKACKGIDKPEGMPAVIALLRGADIYRCDACNGTGIDESIPEGESQGCGRCLGEGKCVSGMLPSEIKAVLEALDDRC